MKQNRRKTAQFKFLLLLAGAAIASFCLWPAVTQNQHAHAQNNAGDESSAAGKETLGPSGLPIPRFVSLKPARVNTRIGPSRDYAVSWLYTKAGLPVEIIQEYDNWRRIRDADGTEGWVYQSLLAGKRTAIIAPWERGKTDMLLDLHASASEEARIVARLEPGVISTIRECTGQWCQLDISGTRGWIRQSQIWGAYPGEVFD